MNIKKTADIITFKMRTLILTCFFLSGMTGLIYQILWTRMIVKVIGAAPFAVSIVLSIFMGGLGVGSYLAGRTVDRYSQHEKLLRIYAILEIIIGCYALIIPFMLTFFKPIYAFAYNHLFGYFILYNLFTFIGCALILCVPVICMGATLPILCRFYIDSLTHLGARAGRLYGLNTIGAAVGSLICGFWLINYLGVQGTLIFAVLVNILIGLSCFLASYQLTTLPIAESNAPEIIEKVPTEAPRQMNLSQPTAEINGALIIFAVSGFCAMAYEVIWTKLLGLIVGPTTYSFTIVLVTFILGLGLGSLIFGWIADKIKNHIWLLVGSQIIAGLLVLAISQLLGNSQLFFGKLIFSFKDNFILLNIAKAGFLFVFLFPSTLFLGATFPLVTKICTQSVSKVARTIGFAYAINIIGAVLGSFCAGFVLIPLVGKEHGLSMVIGLQLISSMVIAYYVLNKKQHRMDRLAFAAVAVISGLFLCFHFPEWDHHSLSSGQYYNFSNKKAFKGKSWLDVLFNGPEILAKAEKGELVYYGDGIGGFTTVVKYLKPLDVDYVMANSGKADASSHKDMPTQTLSAHIPMLFHPNPKNVMVLGLASGVTAGEALNYDIDRLDVLEINPQVVRGSDFFRKWNNHVLSNSKTNLIIQDGRIHLALTRQKYDVIISEPSNPWMAGLATLFTREMFVLAKDRLNHDGIFVQWVHTYGMDWGTIAMIGRTFAEIFPNSVLLSTAPSGIGWDYLLVGFKGQNQLTLENAERNLVYLQKSQNVTLSDPKLLYRLIVSENPAELFGEGPVNKDAWPLLEFEAPKLVYQDDPTIITTIQAKKWLRQETQSVIQQVMSNVDTQIDFAAFALSVKAPFTGMVDISEATPAQKERYFKLVEDYAGNNHFDFAILDNADLERRCRAVQIAAIQNKSDLTGNDVSSYLYLADLYNKNDRPDDAINACLKVLQIEPDNVMTHSFLGALFVEQNDFDQAVYHFNEALRLNPNLADVHASLGVVLMRQGKLDKAAEHFEASLKINPMSVEVQNDLGSVLLSQGKLDQAGEHFRDALRIDPNFSRAHSNLGAVLLTQGKFDQAKKQYLKALEIDPDSAEDHYNLGLVLAKQGHLDDSAISFNAALRIRPTFLRAHSNLGSVLFLQGKFDQAIAQYRKALEIDNNSTMDHYKLGLALTKKGNLREAVTSFNAALRIDPNFSEARQSIQKILSKKSGEPSP